MPKSTTFESIDQSINRLANGLAAFSDLERLEKQTVILQRLLFIRNDLLRAEAIGKKAPARTKRTTKR